MRRRRKLKRSQRQVTTKSRRGTRQDLQCRLRHEFLEERLALNGTGFLDNACPPDLDFSGLGTQSASVGKLVTIDLFASGAMVADLDVDGNQTGDAIRLHLDPDDNPSGATLTTDGIFRWIPAEGQMGIQEFIVIAVDEGSPALADAEVFVVEVFAGNDAPNLAEIADMQATPGQLLEISVNATDPNGDTLSFILDRDDPGANAPEGATLVQLDNGNAVIRWTPDGSVIPGDYVFSVLVIDDGSRYDCVEHRWIVHVHAEDGL